ncbi:hypothetical protein ABBQ32_013999 [Trebouxia sp. C0010 RCD-2024]
MDEDNEKLCGQGGQEDKHILTGEKAVLDVLRQKGLLDQRLTAELAKGKHYWANERRLCRDMLGAQADPAQSVGFDLQDVHRTSEGKSFDYRVLNLMLFKLTKRPYDEALLRFLFVDEHLVDIGDDLVDYEDDVLANSFNIYRAYTHIYGREAQLLLVQRIADFELQYETLLKLLPANVQELVKSRQKDAASVEGSNKWVFPAPILDEAKYRADMAGLSDDST